MQLNLADADLAFWEAADAILTAGRGLGTEATNFREWQQDMDTMF